MGFLISEQEESMILEHISLKDLLKRQSIAIKDFDKIDKTKLKQRTDIIDKYMKKNGYKPYTKLTDEEKKECTGSFIKPYIGSKEQPILKRFDLYSLNYFYVNINNRDYFVKTFTKAYNNKNEVGCGLYPVYKKADGSDDTIMLDDRIIPKRDIMKDE